MKTASLICCSLLICFLVGGCKSLAQVSADYKQALNANLDSFVGKLTTDELVMFAGSPTERTRTSSGGEILTYQYAATTPRTVTTKYYGNGSMFSPHQSVSTEGGGERYYWTVRFMFNDKHVLTSWSYQGDPGRVWASMKYKNYKCK